jgi:hypothetical protein
MKKILLSVFASTALFLGVNAQTTLISPTGDGGFETGGSFAANNWNITGGTQVNQWTVGVNATAGFSGINAAYVSNSYSTTTTHSYVNTSTSVVHFYRDITVPVGETNIQLSFNWLCQGEGVAFDRMRIWLVPTAFTPTAGTQVTTTGTAPAGRIQVGLTNYNLQSTWATANVVIPAAYAGNSFRLVFEWRNDGSGGAIPPAAIDNINLTSASCGVSPTALNTSTILTSSANFTWTAGGTETAWDIYYGSTPLAPPTASTAPTATSAATSYSATGLNPATNYSVYVRANCGGSIIAPWTPVKSFVTASLPEDLQTVQMTAPVVSATGCYASSIPVVIQIKNVGTSMLDFSTNNATIITNITGTNPQSFTTTVNTGTLAVNATQNVTVTATYNMSAVGVYSVNASAKLTTPDANTSNDAMSVAIRTTTSGTPAPYFQDFAAGTTPSGWVNTSSWSYATTHGVTNNGIYYNLYSSAPSASFNLLKLGTLTGTESIAFDYRILNWTGFPTAGPPTGNWGNIKVQVSTDCGATFTDIGTIDNTTHTVTTQAWTNKVYSLAAYAGQNVTIRILGTWASGDYYVDMDNFNIASCFAPTGLAASNITTTTTDLSWITPAAGTPGSYIGEIRTSGAAGSGTLGLVSSGTTTAPTTTANITGLTAFTAYTVYVRSDCGAGDLSTWTSMTFTTLAACPVPTSLTVNALTTGSASVVWTAGGSETAWDVYFGASPLTPPTATTVPTATTSVTSYTATGLTDNTNYSIYVRSNCGTGNESIWTPVTTFYTGYCTPAPISVDDLGITNVDINNSEISNASLDEPGNYGDYTAQTANVYQNTSVPFAITYETGYTYDTKIWIDFNDDLDFNDAGENVYTGVSTSASPTTLTGQINIPAGAQVGVHRLRIGGVDSGPPTPCYTGSYGTYEDYSINIQVPPPCTLTPVAGTISGPTSVNIGTTNSYTISPADANLQWYSSASATGPWTMIAGATNSVQNITAVGNGTVYYTVIASGLGCVNDTANTALSVNIVFPGDAVCNAIPLTIGTSSPYSLFGATVQAGEVAPPATGFSNNTGWGNSTLHNTMWFSFVAPTSGYVTVQSPGFDTQLAIWNAAACADLLSSTTATLVAANDDDAAYVAHGGVIYSSFVSAACLTPGATYFIQLDSYSAAVSSETTTIILTDMGSPLNTSFTGLAANYCLPTGSNTLTPAVTGGLFTINTSTTTVTSFSASTVGSYTVNYALYGCKSTSVTTVNPNPTLTVVASNTAICNGSSVTFTASGATNYTWSPVGGTSDIATVSPTTTSTYSVVGQSTLGCSSTATVALVVNNAPTLSISASSTVICSGGSSSATLTANSSSSNYTWSPSTNTSAVEIVSPTALTVYTVTSENMGCVSTATIAIDLNTTPTLTLSSSTASMCSGSTATLTAAGATNFTWTPSGDLTATSVVTPSATTIYTVTGETAGCAATSTINLDVTQTPTVTASANPTVICLGNNAALTAVSSTPNYSWSPAGGTSDVAIVSPSVTTIYTVTSANGVCVSSTTVSLDVLTAPVLTITPLSSTVCSGSSATLTASGADTYTWSTSGGNAASAVFTPTAMATYTVEGTTACGTGSTTATVNVTSPLTLNATTSSTLLCAGEAATLTATGTASTFTWAPGGQTTAVIAVTPTTTSIYTVSSSNACGVVTATVNQNVSPCAGLQELDLSNISVYPNPSTGIVNFDISSELAGNVSLEMYDAIGKLVVKEELTKEHTVLNISKLEEGIYIFKMIRNNGDVKIGRFVKHN